jgi:hypothetical protein
MERIRIVVAVLSILLIAQIVRSVRREHIRVEYSMTWLAAALLLLILSLSDTAMRLLSRLAGVTDTSLVLIVLAGVLFVFTFFRYSLVVSSLKDHTIQLAQKVGMLEWEVERLSKESQERDTEPPHASTQRDPQ